MLALAPPIQNNSSHTSSVPSSLAASSSRTRLSTRRAYSSSNPSFRSSENPNPYSSTPSSSSNPSIARSLSSASLPVVTSTDHQQGPQAPSRHADSHATDSSSSQAPPPSSNRQPSRQPTPPPPPPSDEPQDSQAVEEPKEQPPKFDIQTYPSADLIRLLASLLTEIAIANDRMNSHSPLQPLSSSLTPSSSWSDNPVWCHLFTASRTSLATPTAPLSFHARNIPTISLESYLLRILRYCPTTNEVFLSLLVYFDRMSKLAQEATGSRFAIDSYNVHRLVIAGVTVASKFFSDVFYTNSRYAKVGGLPQGELNQLELQFLLLNDFKLKINPDEMQRYAEQLILFSEAQAKGKSSNAMDDRADANGVTTVAQVDAPSRPLQNMGAIDAFGGKVAADFDSDAPRNKTPRTVASAATFLAIPSSSDSYEQERGPASAISSEADTDAETDDEPTIRPAHSGTSSETQSLYESDSVNSSTDGIDNDENDDERPAGSHQPQTMLWQWRDNASR